MECSQISENFSVVNKQKNFGTTPKSEVEHLIQNGPKAARKLQKYKSKGILK